MTDKDGTDGASRVPVGVPELLPCFHCRTPEPIQDPHFEYGFDGWIVYCHRCLSSVTAPTREATFAAWNALAAAEVAQRAASAATVTPALAPEKEDR